MKNQVKKTTRGWLDRLVPLALIIFVSPVPAAEIGSKEEPLSLEIHGFVSQGFMVSTDNNYLMNSTRGSFEFTDVGINFTKSLTDDLRVGLQLYSRKLGDLGNFDIKADWFYLDYHWFDWLGIRAGRVKLPFGLYNDSSDADSARVPIFLPQSIYPTQNRDFLLAQTGMEIYGYVDLSDIGSLDYRVYGGTIFLEIPDTPGSPIQVVHLSTPYVVGGRLLWGLPVEGLRVGGSLQALRLDTTLLSSTTGGTADVEIPAVLWVGSLEYSLHDLLLSAEYSRWRVSSDSSDPTVFPSSPTITSERAYAMGSYRVNPWLQPGIYYSLLYPNVDLRSGRENMQHDIAGTLRFDINPYWLVKLEGHYYIGTAALDPSINGGTPLNALEREWGAFMIRTTVYF